MCIFISILVYVLWINYIRNNKMKFKFIYAFFIYSRGAQPKYPWEPVMAAPEPPNNSIFFARFGRKSLGKKRFAVSTLSVLISSWREFTLRSHSLWLIKNSGTPVIFNLKKFFGHKILFFNQNFYIFKVKLNVFLIKSWVIWSCE